MPGKHGTLEKRFWSKVRKTDACWLWTASRWSNGYGKIGSGGRIGREIGAHRVSWEIHYGLIPDGINVLHECDIRQCVRPDHLFLGTKKDNTQDAWAKGRVSIPHLPGEKNGRAKLTLEQVNKIRELGRASHANWRELGRMFGVSDVAARNIATGKSWQAKEGATPRLNILQLAEIGKNSRQYGDANAR